MRSATLLLWRARIRASLSRIVALALLTALGGGIALAVAAGARRTAGAYGEVLRLSNAGELAGFFDTEDPVASNRLIETIPAVGDFSQRVGFGVELPETPIAGLSSYAYYNDPVVVERPIVLEGRLPRAANEVFLNEAAASQSSASVGARLDILLATPDYTEFFPEAMNVTGIGLFPDEVYEDDTAAKPTLLYAKEFVDTHRELIDWGAFVVTVAPGAERAVAAQLVEHGLSVGDSRSADREQARSAIRPLVVTLATLALLAALATIVVVGQALQRLVRRGSGEAGSLTAIGCSRTQLLAADVGVALAAAAAGAAGAIGLAVVASPLFPQGRASRIPQLRGVDVDVTVLVLGAVTLTGALMGLVAVAVTAEHRRRRAEPRPGSAPGVLGSRPTVSTGARFATSRRGLIGSAGGAVVGLASIVAAVTFTGSLGNLVSRPELSGFSWDLIGRDAYSTIDTEAVADQLRDDPDVRRISGLTFTELTIAGRPVPGSVWTVVKGSPWPPLIAGRVPAQPNEVLFSERTLDDLGYEIGDTVAVGFRGSRGDVGERVSPNAEVSTVDMTVVGTTVSPAIGIAGSDTPRLDEGVLVSRDVTRVADEYGGALLLDLVDGADPASVKANFPDGLPDDFGVDTEWFETAQPTEVTQAASGIKVLLFAIAALFIGVMATIAHNLLGFVRERRSAFAVLKALGFTPRQLRSTVLWQSGLVLGAAMIVAIPLGIAAGRWLYQGFAGDIGVIVKPVVPVPALVAVMLGAFVLVQAVALVPASRARRTDAARELRWE